MLRSLPRASIRTLHDTAHHRCVASTEHAQAKLLHAARAARDFSKLQFGLNRAFGQTFC